MAGKKRPPRPTEQGRELERWRAEIVRGGPMEIVPDATDGNLAEFDENGQVVDSGHATDQDTKTTSDVKFNSIESGTFYLGDSETNGSWRIVISGDNLNFERRESGAWVRKGDMRP